MRLGQIRCLKLALGKQWRLHRQFQVRPAHPGLYGSADREEKLQQKFDAFPLIQESYLQIPEIVALPMLMKKNMMAVEKRYSLAAATPLAAELNPLTTAWRGYR